MDDFLSRTVILACIASGLVGCAEGGWSASLSGHGAPALELNRLPVESKVYLRNTLAVPARASRVGIPSSSGLSTVTTTLILEPAEIDRTVSPSTPLLVDRVETAGTPGSQDRCQTTLFLLTTGGISMQLRIAPTRAAGLCSPPSIADIADIAIVVPSPPVPIQ